MAGQFPEPFFHVLRFICPSDLAGSNPFVKKLPTLRLRQNMFAHHGGGRQNSEESELRLPAENQPRAWRDGCIPLLCHRMVHVPIEIQRDPDIHVR